jgi:hypothetical protein
MSSTHYIGKAGQFAVMAELAFRGYNVAIPEIDKGDDVFVLNDTTGNLTRIQVKTATGSELQRYKDAYRCQFSARRDHIDNPQASGTHYIFVGRCGSRWRFVILERGILRHLVANGLGSAGTGTSHIITVIVFGPKIAKSSTRPNAIDLSGYAGNWDPWPSL